MSCESEQQAFETKFQAVQQQLSRELEDIRIDTERRATEIASDFEANNDLASGVGATAGTVVGGIAAGAPGAAVGAIVGKTIGSLFTLEIGTQRQTVSFDVPQVSMKTRQISFDIPQVSIDDRDIIFGVPTIEMQRQKGPPIPETVIEWRQSCVGPSWARVCTKVPQATVRWRDSWIDVPVTVIKQVRITIGMPTVTMQRQDISFDVPETKMSQTELSIDTPYIAIRYIKDAGRRTAALTAALAQSAQEASLKKQLEFKERVRTEVTPLALAMFSCYRQGIVEQRAKVLAPFEPEVAKLSAVVAAIASRGVDASDPELKKAKEELQRALEARNNAAKPFDDALAEFDAKAKEAMDQFLAIPASGDHNKLMVDPTILEGSILETLVSISIPD